MKAIQTKYLGPTNFKGARIKAFDGDNTLTISYPDELSGDAVHRHAAYAFCDKLKWEGKETLVGGHTKEGMVFVFPERV